MSLFDELKRRNVFKVAAAYIIVGWLIMQVGEVMGPALHLPDWVQSALAFFLILGFPVAMVLSWAFELTPEGIRREVGATGSSPGDDDGGTRSPRGRGLEFAIIALLAIAVAVFAFDRFVLVHDRESESLQAVDDVARSDGVKAPPRPLNPSIAVLAFEDMSPQQDQEYLSDGIAEELLNALAQIPDLRVISRSSAFSYKGQNVKLSQVAQELNVAYILEGSIRKAGNRVRITAQLINAEDDTHLWSETYDRTLDDIFAVQDDVALRVATSLRATLTPQIEARYANRSTENLAAYDVYLRGREAFHRYDAESNAEAIRLFEEAIELDSDYALAWAGLADAYAQRDGRFGFAHGSSTGEAIDHAEKALAIDPNLAEAHKALGYAYVKLGYFDQGLEAYLNAVELNPNYYDVWLGLAGVHQYVGRYDEALWAAQRAARLAPREFGPYYYMAHCYKYLSFDDKAREAVDVMLSLNAQGAGALLLRPQLAIYRNDVEAAMRDAENIVSSLPNDTFALVGAAGVAYMAEEYERASEWAKASIRLEPDNTLGYWHYSDTLHAIATWRVNGDSEAEALVRSVMGKYQKRVEDGEKGWGTEWDIATMYAALGDADRAMDWFERAYEAGYRFVRWPPVDPAFDEFREHEVYRRIMGRMTAENARMRERVIEADPTVRRVK